MLNKVADERTKLTANALNSACAGVFVTGVVAPLVAAIYGLGGAAQVGVTVIVLATGVWFLFALALHLSARAVLGRLSE